MVLMSLLCRVFPPRSIEMLDYLDYDALMHALPTIIYSLPQSLHRSVRCIKSQEVVAGTRFKQVLVILLIRRLDALD